MANGKPWGREADEILKMHAGRLSAEEIARKTGHAPDTIRRRMRDAGLPAYIAAHRTMTRRERVMLNAAGFSA